MEDFTEEERNHTSIYKLCIVGNACVGKSNISSRIAVNQFNEAYLSTIGVEFQTKLLRSTHKRNVIKLQIWDTAGQERFRSISASYLRGSSIFVIVYDITDRNSFQMVRDYWASHAKSQANENTMIFLVGNKADLASQRQVLTEEGEELAGTHLFHFLEISAKDGQESTLKLFQWMVDLLDMPKEERVKMLLLETDDTSWNKRMNNLLKNSQLFRNYSGLQIYEPIVKIIAPGLLNKEVLDWIVLNSGILTPAVIQRLAAAAHFFGCEKKKATLEQLVHLYLVAHACKFDLLSIKVVEHLLTRKDRISSLEEVIKNSPKLLPNNSVVDLNEAAMLLIERFHEYKDRINDKAALPDTKRYAELWHNLIGQLYSERDFTGDFSVIVNTRAYKAHKPMLAFATPFFNLADANEVRIEKDISNKAWEQLLQYFYTHDIQALTDPIDCLEVLCIASYLQLDKPDPNSSDLQNHAQLLHHCDTTVYSSITDDNALDRLVAAVNREDLVDKKITIRYWSNNYQRLYAKYENQLTALPKSIMFMLMNGFIKRETQGNKL